MEAETLTATSGTTAGIVEGEQSSSVEIWDDQDHQWTSGPDMPETRAHFCAVPIDSR